MPRLPSRNVRRLFLPATLSLLKLPSKTNHPGCRNHRPHHLRARPSPATGLHHSQTAANLLPVRSPPSGRPGPRGLAGHRGGLSAAAETPRSNPRYGCGDPDLRRVGPLSSAHSCHRHRRRIHTRRGVYLSPPHRHTSPAGRVAKKCFRVVSGRG